jgi:redox-sensitive bicupin YhaK (pirin superfamily)
MYHGQVVPGFPAHPHRGFETVTYVRQGLIDHADSMGAAARYGRGDVQWLTAGSGIQHAEMFPLLRQDRDNPVELFQIWLNLPSTKKMATPRFRMLWAETIPTRLVKDAEGRETRITLVAGRFGDAVAPAPPPDSWAADAANGVAIWTIRFQAGARFTLPAAPGTNRAIYLFSGGELGIAGRSVPGGQRVVLGPEHDVELAAGSGGVELLLLQGRAIAEPVARQGPFVMNAPEELRQAYADYRATQFGGWPWPRHDPVHGRAEERFARHVDGRIEKPA